ncbi:MULTISPECIES: VF530 family protein [Maribacter]|uniref:VF530 family protein n=1 Tax=Maribacter flavus TaxID=1658664 RepID=A0ABU7IKW5_9FLAO|nr:MULTISPECIES: VF530 family protein [Maribacter]MDC6406476.1 VF530 family protein [Maribacter sp. PR66]MEE1973596.1 VF530 family protein [Maribacter flavus]
MEQKNNPLHGVKLVDILEHLTQIYTWEELSKEININCFKNNPSIKSSLVFLRRTPWAREKVEALYFKSLA